MQFNPFVFVILNALRRHASWLLQLTAHPSDTQSKLNTLLKHPALLPPHSIILIFVIDNVVSRHDCTPVHCNAHPAVKQLNDNEVPKHAKFPVQNHSATFDAIIVLSRHASLPLQSNDIPLIKPSTSMLLFLHASLPPQITISTFFAFIVLISHESIPPQSILNDDAGLSKFNKNVALSPKIYNIYYN